jgi:hypothetical protein
MALYVSLVVWVLIVWMIFGVWRITHRRGGRVSPGTALLSSMDLLFDDRRKAAVEVIVEERTGERDPEDKDGNLPELQHPG